MSTPAAPTATFLDGWNDALLAVKRELAHEPCCLECTLAKVQFQGIVASLGAGDAQGLDPAAIHGYLATSAAERLVRTAMEPDLEERSQLLTHTRHLVREQPAMASQVLTVLALNVARHHAYDVDQDGEITPVLPAGEWG